MKATKQCFRCKQQFRREDLIDYTTARSHTPHGYCKKCLEEVQSYERFSEEVCKIFGIKGPGGQINAERKQLKEDYGYSDQTIIDCLHYAYDVEHIEKQKNTLYFVSPAMVERMMKYKREQAAKGSSFAQAMNTSFTKYVVPMQQDKPREKKILDPDDFLDD